MRRRPKLCYLIPAEGFGGAERQAIFHLKNLPGFGFDVVAVTGPGRNVADALQENGIEVRFCSSLPGEYGRPFSLPSYLLYAVKTVINWIRSLLFLRSVVKKERPDVLFAGRVAGWSLAAPVAKRYGIPSLWRFGSRVHGGFRRAMLRLLVQLLPPDAAIANCTAVKKSVSPLLCMPVQVVPNGIEEQFTHNKMSTGKSGTTVPVVGLAIRPSPDKGMRFLREVASMMKDNGTRVRFRIAGEFGWRDAITSVFREHGLSGMVTFLGHVEDIISFYRECDIIALTSRSRSIEGFPNSLLEAMALGKPVIATSAGGVAELVENGVSGVVVDTWEPRIFARKLSDLIADEPYRKKLGKNAAEQVQKLYTKKVVIQKLAAHLEEVINVTAKKKPVRQSGKPVFSRITMLVSAAVLLLQSLFNANAEEVIIYPDTTGNTVPGTIPFSAIPLNEFDVISNFSGKNNYYSILTDGNNGTMIHADYRPPAKTVIFGYTFPDSAGKIDRLRWEWRVMEAPRGSRENVKGKNDSGASVYLLFKENVMSYTIKYVFSNSLPVGTSFEKRNRNPFNVMHMVVASNLVASKTGSWESVEIDVASEFRRLFGTDRYVPLRGVGMLTDGDQTGSRVVADYRDFTYSQTE